MNNGPGAGSNALPGDPQSSALPLYHGCSLIIDQRKVVKDKTKGNNRLMSMSGSKRRSKKNAL